MRCLLIFCLISFNGLSQWHSTTFGVLGTIPSYPQNQFIIDPYRNTLWFVNDIRATVIENDGTMLTFSQNELGSIWSESHLQFAFTPSHIYYSRQQIGLYSFDNYTAQNVFSTSQVIEKMTSDLDTVFFYDLGGAIYKHDGSITSPLWIGIGSNFISKNGIRYSHSGGSVSYIQPPTNVIIPFVDSDYLTSPTNTFSFQRYTDTLYIAQEAGITLVHNIDAFDTITENNTFSMPSSNVLDITFDMNDSLWAVFGDVNGNAFALAKLEGDTWTDIYTNQNCPIDFNTYNDIQFDTDNNIWVVDSYALHTLENTNSPSWLGLSESEKIKFSVYPNPSSGAFNISTKNAQNISEIVVLDVLGREVLKREYSPKVSLILNSGSYVLSLKNGDAVIGREKIVIQ